MAQKLKLTVVRGEDKFRADFDKQEIVGLLPWYHQLLEDDLEKNHEQAVALPTYCASGLAHYTKSLFGDGGEEDHGYLTSMVLLALVAMRVSSGDADVEKAMHLLIQHEGDGLAVYASDSEAEAGEAMLWAKNPLVQ